MKKKIMILVVIVGTYLFLKSDFLNQISNESSKFILKLASMTEYQTIKQDTNNNYLGKGQEKAKNKEGYFTTFTTQESHQKTYKEYKQNGNFLWSNKQYWGGTMAENGCGITAMATILSGYGKNDTPEDLRKKYYPVLDYDLLPKELSSTFRIKNTDFYYDAAHLSKESIQEHLKTNRPILICVWNKPQDNRWTTSSHYMVLLATDDKDMVYISNPNGGESDSKSSGWYNFKEVVPYIAKALYIENYE